MNPTEGYKVLIGAVSGQALHLVSFANFLLRHVLQAPNVEDVEVDNIEDSNEDMVSVDFDDPRLYS